MTKKKEIDTTNGKYPQLMALANHAGQTEKEVLDIFQTEWEATKEELKDYKVLIAYCHVGSWGCDSSAYYLLQHKKTKEFFDVCGGHCSCHGFEGQFSPKPTTLEYILGETFYMPCGGYDNDSDGNRKKVKAYVASIPSQP